MTDEQKSAVLDYIDDQDQLGNHVEPDEVLDVLRELDDHPRDEIALKVLAHEILSSLLDDGLIQGYGANIPEDAEPREPWQPELPPMTLEFGIRPHDA